jgi:hypothetical protein
LQGAAGQVLDASPEQFGQAHVALDDAFVLEHGDAQRRGIEDCVLFIEQDFGLCAAFEIHAFGAMQGALQEHQHHDAADCGRHRPLQLATEDRRVMGKGGSQRGQHEEPEGKIAEREEHAAGEADHDHQQHDHDARLGMRGRRMQRSEQRTPAQSGEQGAGGKQPFPAPHRRAIEIGVAEHVPDPAPGGDDGDHVHRPGLDQVEIHAVQQHHETQEDADQRRDDAGRQAPIKHADAPDVGIRT